MCLALPNTVAASANAPVVLQILAFAASARPSPQAAASRTKGTLPRK